MSRRPLIFSSSSLFLLPVAVSIVGSPAITAQENVPDTVPGRYIVVYRNAVIPGDADLQARAAGVRIVHRNEGFGIATVESTQQAPATPIANRSRLIEPAASANEASILHRLAIQSNVEYVMHDRVVSAYSMRILPVTAESSFSVVIKNASSLNPYDTFYNSPQGWAVRQVGGYGLNTPGGPSTGPWNQSTGKGVRIAILDSGVDKTHPDIAPNLVLNISEINQSELPSVCDDGSPQDQDGHGTWTASLAAAARGSGTGQVIGVAPSADLLNIKVLERVAASGSEIAAQCEAGQASGLLSWVIQGIEDAIANHADVISMSLGATIDLSTGEGAGLKAAFDRVTYAATQAGAVLVAAAGNDSYNLSNPRYIEIPAQSRGVIAVMASTNPACAENTLPGASCVPGSPTVAYYSNYGAPLNAIAAPGGSYPSGDDMAVSGWIRGACSSGLPNPSDGVPSDAQHSLGCFNLGHAAYVQAIGTSASAPLVAGVAALLRAAHPEWDSATVVSKMRSAADTFATLPVPQVDADATLNSK